MSHAQQASIGREELAAQYLSLLQSLAGEIDAAMGAITRNALPEFQDHLAIQETLCLELRFVTNSLSIDTSRPCPVTQISGDEALAGKILAAHHELDVLNRGYASLLKHTGQSLALFSALCRSFQDRLQPANSSFIPQSAWSCEG